MAIKKKSIKLIFYDSTIIPAETGNHVNKPIIKIKPIVNNVDTKLAGPSTLQETTTTTTTNSTNMMATHTNIPVFHKHWRKLVSCKVYIKTLF